MSSTTFDTLAAARVLEDAGLTSKQAEAVTATIRTAIAEGTATRADIAELRGDLAAMRAEARADLAALETRTTRTLYAVAATLLAGQLGAVFALLRLLGG